MRVFKYDMDKLNALPIVLGYAGENKATQIAVNVAEYLAQYPGASCTLLVKNPLGDIYPAATKVVDGELIWEVNKSDTAVAGNGQIEVTISGTNNEILKSAKADTTLRMSLNAPTGEAPDPYQTWLDKLLAAAESVKQMTVDVTVREYGSGNTASYDPDTGILLLGVERGKPFEFTDFTEEQLTALTDSIAQAASDKAAAAALESVREAKEAATAAAASESNAAKSESNAETYAKRAEMATQEAGWFWVEGDDDGNLYFIRSDNSPNDLTFEDDGEGRLVVNYG